MHTKEHSGFSLPGFTLIELIVVTILVGILTLVAVPIYTHSQHTERLRTVTAQLEAALGAIRTLALTGGAATTIDGMPSGYCLQVTGSDSVPYVIQVFSYVDTNGNGYYDEAGDSSSKHVLNHEATISHSDPVPVPDFVATYKSVSIPYVLLKDTSATPVSVSLPTPWQPVLCVRAPQARMYVLDRLDATNPLNYTPNASFTGSVIYELTDTDLDALQVTNVTVDVATGRITSSIKIATSQKPPS